MGVVSQYRLIRDSLHQEKGMNQMGFLGGSWSRNETYMRASCCNGYNPPYGFTEIPSYRLIDLGLRLVRRKQ